MQKPFSVSEQMLSEMDEGVANTYARGMQRVDTVETIRELAGLTQKHTAPQVDDLVADRQQTHGDFRTNARVSQNLKATMRSYHGWEHLDDVERESIDMICLKLSRILSGKSLERQHWEDVEGYAKLAKDECK